MKRSDLLFLVMFVMISHIALSSDPFDVDNKIKISPVVVSATSNISEVPKITEDLPQPEKPAKTISYTVKSGDSLWKIAQELLGDGSRYIEIIEANKEKYPSLLKSPDLIYSGWQFDLPSNEAEEKDDEAELTPPDDAADDADNDSVVVEDDNASSNSDVDKTPKWSTQERVSKLQKAFDTANRALLAQGKAIRDLNSQTIRFLIDNGFMTEEEWMAMNPPSGYHYKLNAKGEVKVVSSDNKALTNEEIAKLDNAKEKTKEEKAKKENTEEAKLDNKKKKVEKEESSQVTGDIASENSEKEDSEPAIDEAAIKKESNARYQNYLKEIGMPDVSNLGAWDYNKAIGDAINVTSGFFKASPFGNMDGYYHLVNLQKNLAKSQKKYEEMVAKGKTSKFLGIFGSTIESAGRKAEKAEKNLEVAWNKMKLAMSEAQKLKSDLNQEIGAAQDKREEYEKQFSEMQSDDSHLDSSNANRVSDLKKGISEAEKEIKKLEKKLEKLDGVMKYFASSGDGSGGGGSSD